MPHLPRARGLAAVCGVLVLVVTGCGEPEESTTFDEATAAVLADAAERLADAIDADDDCLAIAEADGLQERAESALADGLAPPTVAAETVRVAEVLTADLSCEPDDGPADDTGDGDAADEEDEAEDDGGGRDDDGDGRDDGDDRDDDEDDEKEKGNGKGQGKGRGNDR